MDDVVHYVQTLLSHLVAHHWQAVCAPFSKSLHGSAARGDGGELRR
jgi:hypothetical protein